MSKISKIFISIITAVIIFTAVGCSEPEPADESEVLAAAKELIPAAVEVNRIFFWEGLPHVESNATEGIDLGEIEYLDLTEDYMFLSEGDLLNKAKKVYTEAFCKDIARVAFEGVAVSDDEALFARYIVESGIMKINRKISETGLKERLPDISTLKIVEVKHDSAVVSADFTCEGKTESLNITIKLEKDGWRLDTPTY